MKNYLMEYISYQILKIPCVESGRIWSYSDPYFPIFGLNKERYELSLHIQSKYAKIRTRITPNTDISHAVIIYGISLKKWRKGY